MGKYIPFQFQPFFAAALGALTVNRSWHLMRRLQLVGPDANIVAAKSVIVPEKHFESTFPKLVGFRSGMKCLMKTESNWSSKTKIKAAAVARGGKLLFTNQPNAKTSWSSIRINHSWRRSSFSTIKQHFLLSCTSVGGDNSIDPSATATLSIWGSSTSWNPGTTGRRRNCWPSMNQPTQTRLPFGVRTTTGNQSSVSLRQPLHQMPDPLLISKVSQPTQLWKPMMLKRHSPVPWLRIIVYHIDRQSLWPTSVSNILVFNMLQTSNCPSQAHWTWVLCTKKRGYSISPAAAPTNVRRVLSSKKHHA